MVGAGNFLLHCHLIDVKFFSGSWCGDVSRVRETGSTGIEDEEWRQAMEEILEICIEYLRIDCIK
jgi:hypothetical protein